MAADRWARIIVGDLPSVRVDGELVDDVLILAQGAAIDGPGRILGQAGPTHQRPASAGALAFLPAKGLMSFDHADLAKMGRDGTLNDVIAHEMGHVPGIGSLWQRKGLLKDPGTSNRTFTGCRSDGGVPPAAGGGGMGAVGRCRSRTPARPERLTDTGARRSSATS